MSQIVRQEDGLNAKVVAVAATKTVLVPSTAVGDRDLFFLSLTNGDGSQTLNANVETSVDGVNWYVAGAQSWQGIGPGATAEDIVSVRGRKFIRATGSASGAGLNSTVTSELQRFIG